MTDYSRQVRLSSLLRRDQFFRSWFQKPPTLHIAHALPWSPWRLYIQEKKDGRWAKADFRGYVRAYTELRLRLPEVWDITLHSKAQHFQPPILRIGEDRYYNPVPIAHRWCSLCRRPTMFLYFSRHPALPGIKLDNQVRRCKICGIRENNLKKFPTPLVWPVQSGK